MYDIIQELVQHVHTVRGGGAGMPNTRAVARRIIDEAFPHYMQDAKDADIAKLLAEQLAFAEPAFQYFEKTIITDMRDVVNIYKACRLFHPARIDALGGNADAVEKELKTIPFLTEEEVAELVLQLPVYRAMAIGDVAAGGAPAGDESPEAWWYAKEGVGLQPWRLAAAKVMILQVSSAAAERVFSMLKAIMGDQQAASALQDYQQTAIMTRYNQLQRQAGWPECGCAAPA